jgi:hypothetical protein
MAVGALRVAHSDGKPATHSDDGRKVAAFTSEQAAAFASERVAAFTPEWVAALTSEWVADLDRNTQAPPLLLARIRTLKPLGPVPCRPPTL